MEIYCVRSVIYLCDLKTKVFKHLSRFIPIDLVSHVVMARPLASRRSIKNVDAQILLDEVPLNINLPLYHGRSVLLDFIEEISVNHGVNYRLKALLLNQRA